LWRIVNDTLQIHGGAGFFTDRPFERMMRDARLNTIGEGANEVLRCFNCMVGLRNVGRDLEGINIAKPWTVAKILRSAPTIPVSHSFLQPAAAALSRQILAFSRACRWALIKHREEILEQQCLQARLGDVATELFTSSCVYSRLSSIASDADRDEETRDRDLQTGLFYLKCAHRRNAQRLAALSDNDDVEQLKTANAWLSSPIFG
jgi:alkylation response protein AidB-like acyl-CoA dehydrogenase